MVIFSKLVSSMDAKITGQKYNEKKIFTVSNYVPKRYLLITKGKSNNCREEKPGRHPLNQVSKLINPNGKD